MGPSSRGNTDEAASSRIEGKPVAEVPSFPSNSSKGAPQFSTNRRRKDSHTARGVTCIGVVGQPCQGGEVGGGVPDRGRVLDQQLDEPIADRALGRRCGRRRQHAFQSGGAELIDVMEVPVQGGARDRGPARDRFYGDRAHTPGSQQRLRGVEQAAAGTRSARIGFGCAGARLDVRGRRDRPGPGGRGRPAHRGSAERTVGTGSCDGWVEVISGIRSSRGRYPVLLTELFTVYETGGVWVRLSTARTSVHAPQWIST